MVQALARRPTSVGTRTSIQKNAIPRALDRAVFPKVMEMHRRPMVATGARRANGMAIPELGS